MARAFDPVPLLLAARDATRLAYSPKQIIFTEDDAADTVFYLQTGHVLLSVVSGRGKAAVIEVLEHGSFLGESAMTGQALRTSTASALAMVEVIRVSNAAFSRIIRREPLFAEYVIKHLIVRKVRLEDDVLDLRARSAEARIARILINVARPGAPQLNQVTIGAMAGCSRERVSISMMRFRRRGFIKYNGRGFEVDAAALAAWLREM